MATNVALIVGVTGIVGGSLLEAMREPSADGACWKVHGIARGHKPEWFQDNGGAANYIQCDLTDRKQAFSKLSSLEEVTHVFWATWTKGDSEQEDCEANGSMLDNLLDALFASNAASSQLKHICLTTGAKHYLGPHSRFGSVQLAELPFRENLPRRQEHPNFYYVLEDKVFAACNSRPGLTWSVHRPNIIFGFGPRNYASVLGSIIIYGTICNFEGLKFNFPGSLLSWESQTNVSDAEIIAEQQLWAAAECNPQAKNEAFNVVNGDLVTWKQLWGILAEQLQVEAGNYRGEPFSMAEFMSDKGENWKRIAKERSLLLRELDQKQWWAVDLCLNFPFQLVSSLDKCRSLGFCKTVDTLASIPRWIHKMRDQRMIP